MPRPVVLALASEPQEAILCAALQAHGVSVTTVPPAAHLETTVMQAMRDAQPPLLVIDLAALAQLANGAAEFCAWQRSQCSGAEVMLYCSGLYTVNRQARTWAQQLGALDLLPGCDLAHHHDSLLPALGTLLKAAGVTNSSPANDAALQRALQALTPALDSTAQVAQAWRHIDALRDCGFEPGELLALMAGANGVGIQARTYRTKTYDECFVGADAVNWLMQTTHVTHAEALRIGQALLELGHVYHVVREQPFQDGHFFYRISANTPRLNALDLCAVTTQMRTQGREGGVSIADRPFHGVTYPACFVGAHAVKWMREQFDLNENEAMTLGQRLMDLFLVHHVVDGQPFRGGTFFYRFYQDENQDAGIMGGSVTK
jgi:hypothetical protein